MASAVTLASHPAIAITLALLGLHRLERKALSKLCVHLGKSLERDKYSPHLHIVCNGTGA